MGVSPRKVLAFKSYQYKAEVLVKNYLLAEPLVPYTAVLVGILAFKLVYDLIRLISSFYFRTYNGLTKIQRIEWNNRGVSTLHAIFISTISLYFVLWSDLFSDNQSTGLITFRNSTLSTVTLGNIACTSGTMYAFFNISMGFLLAMAASTRCLKGQLVSVGYFVSDLGMICWMYPSLGGVEYIVHHSLSGIAVAYSMFTREGQLYTFMVLISEVTTPEINMRWFLDIAGLKKSNSYLINGVVIFFAWLGARILLFVFIFYHVYLHHDQVIQMHIIGFLLVHGVPSALAIMNLMWFRKIINGLKKAIAKKM